MKKIILFSFIFAAFFVFYIVAANFYSLKTSQSSSVQNVPKTPIEAKNENKAAMQNKNESSKTLNEQEIAKHTQINDCWTIYGDKVLDITGYFGKHPGGDQRLLPFCGGNMTQAFDQQGHSNFALELMNDYYIGNLDSVAKADTKPGDPTSRILDEKEEEAEDYNDN